MTKSFLAMLVGQRLEQVAIGLRGAEQRPAAHDAEGVEVGIGGEDVGHRLHALGAVVIGEHRAAGDFRPAAFALRAPSRPFWPVKRVAHALGAAQDVVGAGIALDGADLAALRLGLLDVLADLVRPSGSCRCRDRSCAAPRPPPRGRRRASSPGPSGWRVLMRLGDQLARSTARSRSRQCRPCPACPARSAPRRPRRRSRPGRCRSTRTPSLAFSLFHFSQPWWIASKNGLSRPLTTMTSCFLASAWPVPSASQRPLRQARVTSSCFHPPSSKTTGHNGPPIDSGGKPNLGMRRASMLFVLQNGSITRASRRRFSGGGLI